MPESRRREFLAAAGIAGLAAAAVGGCSSSERTVVHGEHGISEDTVGLTPQQAMTKIEDGNARFVAMKEIEPNVSSDRLMAVARGQRPFVGVLGCVDSRVPPELVFDRDSVTSSTRASLGRSPSIPPSVHWSSASRSSASRCSWCSATPTAERSRRR